MSLWKRLEQKAHQAGSALQGAIQRSKEPATNRNTTLENEEGLGLIERQRRILPFNDFSGKTLLPTDPPSIAWSNGIPATKEDINEEEWQLQVVAGVTDSNGWTYSFNWNFTFEAAQSSKTFVRKRFWVRRYAKDMGESNPALTEGIRGWLYVLCAGEEEAAGEVGGAKQEEEEAEE
eukprot:CAMPEP_0177734286 /NCGR_PEP_ID=MMETSP0484_2-20121128/24148_1 /TAXON_ID=354590 /ORGANISM="Rhodomonas lens, Strain RHODO" /LENGTH=176 /DNA_ID=CAMNT_0019247745 /DNA_START=98 /DNA_END=625 /DNA_ORIENTATION=+